MRHVEPIIEEDPRDHGFYMPAEWHPHSCTWMGWPHRQDYWIAPLEDTQAAYAEVANTIAEFEPLKILVSQAGLASAKKCLSKKVSIVDMEIDQPWLRDTGPNFLIDDKGGLAGSTWQFNCWGKKYRLFANDALIGERILVSQGLKNYTSSIYAEGGGISVDGEGTVLTTEQCFLHENRNPHFSRDEIEQELLRTLGAQQVIWLKGDPADDETDGHIDGIAAFVAPGKILAEQCRADGSLRRDVHEENVEILKNATDAKGRALDVTVIEEASEAIGQGDVFCASYVNTFIANGAVIMPDYRIDRDNDVKRIFEQLFPGREVVKVPVHNIAIGGGGIHCITQQQPKP